MLLLLWQLNIFEKKKAYLSQVQKRKNILDGYFLTNAVFLYLIWLEQIVYIKSLSDLKLSFSKLIIIMCLFTLEFLYVQMHQH